MFSVAYMFLIDTNSVEDSTKGTFEQNAGSPGASLGASEEVIPKKSPEPRPEEPKKRPKARPKTRPKAVPDGTGYDAEDESAASRMSLGKKAMGAAGATMVSGGTSYVVGKWAYNNFPSYRTEKEDPTFPRGPGGPPTQSNSTLYDNTTHPMGAGPGPFRGRYRYGKDPRVHSRLRKSRYSALRDQPQDPVGSAALLLTAASAAGGRALRPL